MFKYRTYISNTITFWVFIIVSFVFFEALNNYLGLELTQSTLGILLTCLSVLFGFYMACISLFAGSSRYLKSLNIEDKNIKRFIQTKVQTLIGIITRGLATVFVSLFICFILLIMPKNIYTDIINLYFVKAIILSIIISNMVHSRFFMKIMFNCFTLESK